MAIKNEKGVKDAVAVTLRSTHKCWFFMPAANGFGRPGIPDFVGSVNGNMFAIETKFGSNGLSQFQQIEINNIVVSGAKVWIVRETNLREFEAEFMGWAALCS